MRLPFYLAAILLLQRASSEEQSWSWGSDQKDAPEENAKEAEKDDTDGRSSRFYNEDLIAAPSEFIDNLSANSTEAGQIIDEIISSTREGRAIDGFDEVYSDPNVQDALQKGDDSEARNIIKERLCALGLMQCEDIEGKRPYYSPEELIYAQPISINPVGKPIPTIPIKGVRGIGGYGPPKPLPYPSTRPIPPGKYPSLQNKYPYPGSSNSFSPPGGHIIQQGGPNYFQQGKPPRRHFGVPSSKPFYGKPSGLNGEVYEGAEYFGNKPPSFIPGANEFSQPIEPEIPPYKYVQQSGGQFSHNNKDKRVEITVNAQGGTTATVGGVTPGTLEHVHHHYHHNAEGANKPVIINPIPIASAAVSTSDLSSHSFNAGNFGAFKPSASVSTSVGLGSFGSTNGYHQGQTLGTNGYHQGQTLATNGFQGQTLATNGYQQGTYGGQSIANYGVKPVNEGYPEQQSYDSFGASVGAYGTTGLYKKELNLNSGNSNYLQSGYADKYQGLESARAENYDCVCVPYDQCPTHDVLGRKDDLYLPLDPRSLKTDIEALSDEERVITDGNGTMTVIKVAKNGTSETNQEVKKVSKREAPVDAPVKDDAKPEARQYGSLGGNLILNMKKIKPTFGVSFGLPQQGGGGYPVNPYGPSPFSNPYGGAVGASGINLGLVSVNPLVSVQVTKDDYGNKEIKPFINLHVTPNNYLVNKFEDLFAYKKGVIFNKHKHYHVHKGDYPNYHGHYPSHQSHYPNYHSHYPHDVYREHPHEFEHGPHYSSPPFSGHYPSEVYDKPPFLQGFPPNFEPNYPSYPPTHDGHHPGSPSYPPTHDGHHPGSYYDDSLNYGGGDYPPSPFYGRAYQNNTNFFEGDDVLQQYQNQYDQGVNYYGKNDFDNENTRSFRGGKSLNINSLPQSSSNPIKFPSSRKRRDVNNTNKNITKRQFYGGNGPNGISGRPQTCGPRHVCCKRPLRPQVPNVNKQCGTRHSQGINGRIKNPVYIDGDSEFGEYPWQVAILKKDSKESVYVCGGTLIDHLHILTAAHCVKTYTGFDLRARLGEWDVNHDVEFYPYIERDVVSVQVHPEFYAGTLYNDIAILRMDAPVDWSKYPHISPACLPHPHDDYTGTRCWTTGWGKDAFGDFGKYQNILKEVDVPVIGNDLCQRQLQTTRLGYDFKLHPGFVCAGGEEGKDACKGDGGGPMVCERGGTWQVVGLVSWGIGCGQNGIPGVYVKVGHYVDWIRQVTQRY